MILEYGNFSPQEVMDTAKFLAEFANKYNFTSVLDVCEEFYSVAKNDLNPKNYSVLE